MGQRFGSGREPCPATPSRYRSASAQAHGRSYAQRLWIQPVHRPTSTATAAALQPPLRCCTAVGNADAASGCLPMGWTPKGCRGCSYIICAASSAPCADGGVRRLLQLFSQRRLRARDAQLWPLGLVLRLPAAPNHPAADARTQWRLHHLRGAASYLETHHSGQGRDGPAISACANRASGHLFSAPIKRCSKTRSFTHAF